MDCYCDYDPPRVYSPAIYRARKRYSCDECRGPILPGERYENLFGVWDGCASTFHTCERCVDLRTWTKNNVPCFCWMHGDMDQMMREAVEDAVYRAPQETRGLHFGLLRRFVLRRRHNELARAA